MKTVTSLKELRLLIKGEAKEQKGRFYSECY